MAHSKSRNVNSYVKACIKYNGLKGRLKKKLMKLDPLRGKTRQARLDAVMKSRKMTGSQMGEAQRILLNLKMEQPKSLGDDIGDLAIEKVV